MWISRIYIGEKQEFQWKHLAVFPEDDTDRHPILIWKTGQCPKRELDPKDDCSKPEFALKSCSIKGEEAAVAVASVSETEFTANEGEYGKSVVGAVTVGLNWVGK